MKKLALAGAVLTSFVAFVPAAFAYSSPGSPTGYVNDFAGVLSATTKQSLESELASFEKATLNEVTVAIVPSMGGDYIENYAVKLFEEWKIGKKDKDNGVLLVLSIAEHKMRIEVGYGLEGALPDSVAQSILNNEMTPKLKAGDYDGAVTAGAQAIEQATKGEYASTQSAAKNSVASFLENNGEGIVIFAIILFQFLASIFARSKSWWAGGVVGLLGGLGIWWLLALSFFAAAVSTVLLAIFGLLFDYVVSRGYENAKSRGVTPPWWFGGSGGIGGSSGGGFGGFGGGGSGGGGASGGW